MGNNQPNPEFFYPPPHDTQGGNKEFTIQLRQSTGCVIELFAGGGGGGGGNLGSLDFGVANNGMGGGGGGGGTYVNMTCTNPELLTGNAVITVYIGWGGQGGYEGSNGDGSDGNPTYIKYLNDFIQAEPGKGGQLGHVDFSGGNGGDGGIGITGTTNPENFRIDYVASFGGGGGIAYDPFSGFIGGKGGKGYLNASVNTAFFGSDGNSPNNSGGTFTRAGFGGGNMGNRGGIASSGIYISDGGSFTQILTGAGSGGSPGVAIPTNDINQHPKQSNIGAGAGFTFFNRSSADPSSVGSNGGGGGGGVGGVLRGGVGDVSGYTGSFGGDGKIIITYS